MKELKYILEIENNTRIKFVLLDNLVELKMFQIIQEHSFDEWISIEGNAKPKERIVLYRFFSNKIDYAIKKKIISRSFANSLLVFHDLRNSLYHQGETIGSDITNHLFTLYSVLVLENLFHSSKTYVHKNKSIKTKIIRILSQDILGRIKNLKDRLNYAETNNESYDEKVPLSEFQLLLNHLVYNYGHTIIEKSNIDYRRKMKILKKIFNNPDYVNLNELKNDDILFFAHDIQAWEKIAINMAQEKNFYIVLNNWHKINEKLSILEELLDYHIYWAC